MALTEEDKSRIREDVAYLLVALKALPTDRKSRFERLFGFASNAFVLAIIGVLFTYFIGPGLQRRYEEHKRRQQAVQDCFTEFLKYATSPFEEYYAILPISNRNHIDDKEFDSYQAKLATIHLRRFEAYARIQGFLSVVRDSPGGEVASASVKAYAVLVREFADRVDNWLNVLRCEPHCVDEGKDRQNTGQLYELMHAALHELEPREDEPISLILKIGAQQ